MNLSQRHDFQPPRTTTPLPRLRSEPVAPAGQFGLPVGDGYPAAMDELSEQYAELLQGSYDCVDRIVLNAYNSVCHSAGGFRQWWRRLDVSDEQFDNAHLMRMDGRFSRRVRGFAKARQIP